MIHEGNIIFGKHFSLDRTGLLEDEQALLRKMNDALLNACRLMPSSFRSEAVLFLYQYSGSPIGEELNYFKEYYPPSFTILARLMEKNTKSQNDQYSGHLIEAHSMALLLHSLDDHLVDQSLILTHLLLQFRTVIWLKYQDSLNYLVQILSDGKKIVERVIDDYFRSIQETRRLNSLDSYLDRFRKQMGTWSLQPYLLALELEGIDFANKLLLMYESFGIAWRLADDYQDLEEDLDRGDISSMIYFLPNELRADWNSENRKEIANIFRISNSGQKAREKVKENVLQAISIATELNLDTYADSLKRLISVH
ncbi:hypothetical protein CH373_17600 [Leptospira perolatii]|uniref:Polyprenyl synthetase n=1 Tax=Leptospira perolatii TaxID=2023191 RepID=A0A2M9ZIB1_9LEPT|nr:class 1 isoprenoid biosynthesis enzyme [Leptospira perolatii]PJZ69087.1 hypothetical protein CH360_12445 [Leptospira perolatii]PJZ71796.1 hypothetical protein CH373_17600 [Leptospira perolatii]